MPFPFLFVTFNSPVHTAKIAVASHSDNDLVGKLRHYLHPEDYL